MGFRFRRRVSLAPGLRFNLGKRGASLSVGTRGAWFTVGPKGGRATAGLPGTGLSWTATLKKGRATKRQPHSPDAVDIEPPDLTDANSQAIQARASEQTPQTNKNKNFIRLCVFAFALAFGVVWAFVH